MYKKLLFIFISLNILLSSPLYPIRKETKLILEQLAKITKRLDSIEEKMAINSTEINYIYKRFKVFEDRLASVAKNQADQTQSKESLMLSLQFIKEELNEIKDQMSRLTSRVANLSIPATQPTETSETSGTEADVATQNPDTVYYTAYSDYLKNNYDLAIQGFQQFLSLFPTHDLSHNSLYWVGECYYSQKKYTEAVSTFTQLLQTYQEGNKVAAATLKKGYALIEMGNMTQGVEILKELISKFPLSEEAALARQKIKEINGSEKDR